METRYQKFPDSEFSFFIILSRTCIRFLRMLKCNKANDLKEL